MANLGAAAGLWERGEDMEPPSKSEVAERLRLLIGGKISREEASRWAGSWITAERPPGVEPSVWEAVLFLGMVDTISLDRPYLYEIVDFEEELKKLS